ncbi:protein of unknown function [Thauera humireducens]|nr:protein of unknown function [Thauera humireducens]
MIAGLISSETKNEVLHGTPTKHVFERLTHLIVEVFVCKCRIECGGRSWWCGSIRQSAV